MKFEYNNFYAVLDGGKKIAIKTNKMSEREKLKLMKEMVKKYELKGCETTKDDIYLTAIDKFEIDDDIRLEFQGWYIRKYKDGEVEMGRHDGLWRYEIPSFNAKLKKLGYNVFVIYPYDNMIFLALKKIENDNEKRSLFEIVN